MTSIDTIPLKKERVMFYIDGFNLYFGMIEAGLRSCKWLDINKLALAGIKHNQELIGVKYFTSNITNNPPKESRQRIYIDALQTTGVIVIKGKYESKQVICEGCGKIWYRSNEKKTDVNIATNMIFDALQNKFDIAILISGDSDLIPAINMVNNQFSPKKVCVAFPPSRHNISVADAATGSYTLGRKRLLDCQFSNEVEDANGFKLKKPDTW